ncbi:MAG: acyl-CoA dehydrogenase family protein [Caulobacteraceae bacterium]
MKFLSSAGAVGQSLLAEKSPSRVVEGAGPEGAAISISQSIPAHEAFRAKVRRFMESDCAPFRDAWQKAGRTPESLWRRAGELGLLCVKAPPQFGGGGGDMRHSLIIIEEQTRICFNELTFYLHSDIVAPYIERYGTEHQRERYLAGMARGEWVGAIAMTEPSAGSDVQAIRTTAKAINDGYLLNGQKVFISNGQVGNLILVAAKTDPDGGAKGISLFVLETERAEGFARGRNLRKLGCKAQDSSELFFEDVRLPAHALLGGVEGRGFAQMMDRLPEERLIMSMSAVAMMEEAVKETARWLREAEPGSLVPSSAAGVDLAECKAIAMGGRAFLEQAIDLFIDGDFDATDGAMIKWWTTERQFEVVDRCLQLRGQDADLAQSDLARRFADSRLGRIAGGANEVMKELVGRSL